MPARQRKKRKQTYAAAGVDLAAADSLGGLLGPIVRRTFGPRVFTDHGGFAGAFRLDYDERLFARNYREPVLLACTDGVGSKLLLALEAERFDTIGIDLVAMNVNDLLTAGGEPLLFLDYIAVHQLAPERVAAIVQGVAAGCEAARCALLGGETAELPELYQPGHFDLAGFALGVVERQRIIRGEKVRAGDVAIGLASNGVHSNGYALVRKALLADGGLPLDKVDRTLGEPLIDALLRPTRIYVRPVLAVLQRYQRPVVTAMAHITGGGLPGNLPRILPDDCDLVIRRGSWEIPPIFALLERHDIDEEEMYRVFNMGIGYVLVVRPRAANAIIRVLAREDIPAAIIGTVKAGRGRVELR